MMRKIASVSLAVIFLFSLCTASASAATDPTKPLADALQANHGKGCHSLLILSGWEIQIPYSGRLDREERAALAQLMIDAPLAATDPVAYVAAINYNYTVAQSFRKYGAANLPEASYKDPVAYRVILDGTKALFVALKANSYAGIIALNGLSGLNLAKKSTVSDSDYNKLVALLTDAPLSATDPTAYVAAVKYNYDMARTFRSSDASGLPAASYKDPVAYRLILDGTKALFTALKADSNAGLVALNSLSGLALSTTQTKLSDADYNKLASLLASAPVAAADPVAYVNAIKSVCAAANALRQSGVSGLPAASYTDPATYLAFLNNVSALLQALRADNAHGCTILAALSDITIPATGLLSDAQFADLAVLLADVSLAVTDPIAYVSAINSVYGLALTLRQDGISGLPLVSYTDPAAYADKLSHANSLLVALRANDGEGIDYLQNIWGTALPPAGLLTDAELDLLCALMYDGEGNPTAAYLDPTGYVSTLNQVVEDGVRYQYDRQGTLVKTTVYWDDGVTPKIVSDYAAGVLTKVSEYTVDGTLQKVTEYWSNGNPRIERFYDDPLIPGEVTENRYDLLGRLTMSIFDDGRDIRADYWGETLNKNNEYYYSANVWQKTVRYYSDGVTKNYEWFKDLNPATAGDLKENRYDALGHLTMSTYDDNSNIRYSYWTGTGDLYQAAYYNSGNVWQNTIEYYRDGVTMHLQWLRDANTGATGDVVYNEYDSLNKKIAVSFDDKSSILSLYWTSTGNKHKDIFFGPLYAWQKMTTYDHDGLNGVDSFDPAVTNQSDELGRSVITVLGGGDFRLSYYWGLSTNKYKQFLFGPGWKMKSVVEYYEDGTTLHYKKTYDAVGRLIQSIDYQKDETINITYWSESGLEEKERKYYITSTNTWKQTSQYYADGKTTHYIWMRDVNPGVVGDVFELCYDTTSRLTKKTFDDASNIRTDYWGTTFNKYNDYYYDAANAWTKTVRYYSDGTTKNYEWFKDNAGVPGEVKENRYDTSGRLTMVTLDDSSNTRISYWGTTNAKYQVASYSTTNIWQHTAQYWENGTTLRYEWIASGYETNDTYREYDRQGRITKRKLYAAEGGFLSFQYVYDAATGYRAKERAYLNSDYTSLYTIATRFANSANRVESYTRMESGVQTTYLYGDVGGGPGWYVGFMTASAPAGTNDVYSQYLADGSGRLSYGIRSALTADEHGAYSYIYSYYDTGELHAKYAYADQLWGDGFDTLVNSKLLGTYVFDKATGVSTWNSEYVAPVQGDVNEFEQRMAVQAKINSYTKTAEGGFVFTPAMVGEPEKPFQGA